MLKKELLFLLCFFLIRSLAAQSPYAVETVPNPQVLNGTFLSNPDSILSRQEGEVINFVLQRIEDSSGVEAAVVVLNSIGKEDTKNFRYKLFNHWGIGKKGKDNGLLLLIVKDQRTWDFETGYGLESVLPDGRLKIIGERLLVPQFKKDSMMMGIVQALLAIERVIHNDSTIITALDQNTTTSGSEKEYVFIPDENERYLYNGEVPLSWIHEIHLYCWAGYGIFLAMVVYSFFDKKKHKNFLTKTNDVNEIKTGIPISYSRWIFFYILLPISIPLASYSFMPSYFSEFTDFSNLLFLGTYVVISLLVLERMLRASHYCRHENKQTYIGKLREKNGTGLLIFLSLLFPFFMIPYFAWISYKKQRIRNQPFPCINCGTVMYKLGKEEEKKHLSAGQQKEEELKSVEHDIWSCGQCQQLQKFAYVSEGGSYTNCTSCGYRTALNHKSVTLVAATYYDIGKERKEYSCKNCGSNYSKEIDIPRRTRTNSGGSSFKSSSSSSSSSSGGGSRGGSFGGGRSGGGGSGGKW